MKLAVGYFFLFTALAIWSTSSTVVVKFKDTLPPFQSASFVILLATITMAVVLAVGKRTAITDICKCNAKDLFSLFGLGLLGFFLYQIFYFYSLHSSLNPLEANIINYLWLIVAIAVGFIIKAEAFTYQKTFGVLFAFGGALLTTNAGTQLFELQFNRAHLFAFIGSITYGLYTALLKKLKVTTAEDEPHELSTLSKFFVFLVVSTFLHLISTLAIFIAKPDIIYEAFHRLSTPSVGLYYLIIYTLLNLCLAYFSWIVAVDRIPLSHTIIIAYLIPTFSTILLSYFTQKAITPNLAYGLILILLGFTLVNNSFYYVSPLVGVSISLVFFGIVAVFVPPAPTGADVSTMLKAIVAVFSILSSFILNRAINKYGQENNILFSIESNVSRILEAADAKSRGHLDDFMALIMEEKAKLFAATIEDQLSFDERVAGELAKISKSVTITNPNINYDISADISNIRKLTTDWKFIREQSVSLYEWIILVGLAIVAIFCFFQSRELDFWSNLSSIIFGSSICLILLAIFDYDRGKPGELFKVMLMTQSCSRLLSKPPYIPKFIIDMQAIPCDIQVRTRDNNNIEETMTIKKQLNIYRLISLILFILTLIGVVYAISFNRL